MNEPKNSNNPYFKMLWKWFEDRGAIGRQDYSDGLTPEDFKRMLDEHESEMLNVK